MTADELRAELRDIARDLSWARADRDDGLDRRSRDRLNALEQRILIDGIQPEEVRK